MEFAALAFLFLQLLEVMARIASTGNVMSWLAASGWHVYDMVVLLWSLAASLGLTLGAKQTLSKNEVDWLEITRAMRVLRVVSVVPAIRSFLQYVTGVRSSSSVLRMSVVFTFLYASVTYSFGLIGIRLFGKMKGGTGPISGDDDASAKTVNDDEGDGQVFTFRSLAFSLLALFQIETSNNWNSILYPAVN